MSTRPASRNWWLEEVLPWILSGTLHLGLIISAVLLYKTIETMVKVQEQNIIPDATMIDNAPVGSVPNPGLGADPHRRAAQDQVADATLQEVRAQGQRLNRAVAGGTEGTNESILGVGPNGSFARGAGIGTGDGGENGGGIFGMPGGGGGGGPKVSFIGQSTNATKIVYLCDASGSMISVFTTLQRQMRQSIDGLRLPQSFGVVFFSETPRLLGPGGTASLLLANPDNKKKAAEFINQQVASGATKPATAIAAAFAMQPQLIFVLTDGFDQGDPNEIAAQFRKLNRDKKIKINTILLRSTDDPELVKVLRGIAIENGGTYKEVDKQDF